MANQPSIRDIILIFFRRKMLFVLVCLGGGAYLLLKEPQYLSTASLVLHFDHEVVANIDRVDPKQPLGPNERREILSSDADILKSTWVVDKVIDKVGLGNLYPHIAARTDYSDAKKFDLATRTFMEDFVVDVGLQSDVLNVSFFNANAVIARDTVKELLS